MPNRETLYTRPYFDYRMTGLEKLQFGLPANVEVQAVWVERARVARHFEAQDLVVLLPGGRRFVSVAIVLREPASTLLEARHDYSSCGGAQGTLRAAWSSLDGGSARWF